MKKLIILLLLCLFLVSCEGKNNSEKSDITESETQVETESETERIDLNKEISENYTNKVVSYEAFMEFYEDYPCDTNNHKNYPTYYELVKALDSTGINTSDNMYRYEWELDNGMYLHAYFLYTEYKAGELPIEISSYRIFIHRFSYNPEVIKQYRNYSQYLYDIYYHTRFNDYFSFVDWIEYADIPRMSNTKIYTDEEVDRILEERIIRPVDKKAALSLKDGMTYREAVALLGSCGEEWSGIYVRWKVDDNFYLLAKYTLMNNPFVNPDVDLYLIKYAPSSEFTNIPNESSSRYYNHYYYTNYLRVFIWD